METLQALMTRHSVREFDSDRKVPDADLQIILRAAMQAPSARDTRPCHFVVVRERAALDALAAALPHARMCAGAPLAIVVCGDGEKTEPHYLSTDCSAAAMSILLAAHALGLGAVWTAVHPREERMKLVRERLGVPESVVPFCLIPVGYPAPAALTGKAKEKYEATRIHRDRW